MAAPKPGKISLALGGSKKSTGPTNGIKRSHAALQDHDEEDHEHGKSQRISHFDRSAGGAFDDSRPREDNKPMIIASQANRDWKEASARNRRQNRSSAPEESQNRDREAEIAARDAAAIPAAGLTVRKRDEDGATAITNGHSPAGKEVNLQDVPSEGTTETTFRQRTDDEVAMDALLGRNTQPDLVVPAISEEEAFERDVQEAPDMATLDDYARVPVEQFGAALLRGMGWKDGEGIGSNRGQKLTKTKIPERRPALLGIGAKEEAAVAQELGTWGKAAKDKKGPQVVYNPVLLRDKQTGELFTEEELQKRKEKDEREKYEQEFDEKERKKEKDRRRRDDSRERDDRRQKDRGSERRDDRDRERDRDRHRRRHDDSDEEYRRRKKEKERRYLDSERDERAHHSRSSRYDRDEDRHRDRDRRR